MIYEDEPATARDRLPAVLGIASVMLLAATLRWAHHWGALAGLIGALVVAGIAAAAGADPAGACGGG